MGVTLRNHVTSHLMTKSVSGGVEGGVPSLQQMSKENRVLKTLHTHIIFYKGHREIQAITVP